MIEKLNLYDVGLLDERFFNIFSDFDFVWRLKKKGLKVIATPEVTIDHFGEASLTRFMDRKAEYDRGRKFFEEKWKNEPRYDEFRKLYEKEALVSLEPH